MEALVGYIATSNYIPLLPQLAHQHLQSELLSSTEKYTTKTMKSRW